MQQSMPILPQFPLATSPSVFPFPLQDFPKASWVQHVENILASALILAPVHNKEVEKNGFMCQ